MGKGVPVKETMNKGEQKGGRMVKKWSSQREIFRE